MIEIIILVLVIANLIIELAILLKLRDKYAADLDFLVEVPPPQTKRGEVKNARNI